MTTDTESPMRPESPSDARLMEMAREARFVAIRKGSVEDGDR